MTYNPDDFPRPTQADALQSHMRLEKVQFEEHDEDGTFNTDYLADPSQAPAVEKDIKTLQRYLFDDSNNKVVRRNLNQLRSKGVHVSDASGQAPTDEEGEPQFADADHAGVTITVNERTISIDEQITR